MTREEAIKWLEFKSGDIYDHVFYGDEAPEWEDYEYEALRMAIEALKQTAWIPCSERLPKIEQDVLIWEKNNTYEIAHLDIREWTEDELIWYPQYNRLGDEVEWEIEEVIAWMPLPEPWKGEADG